MIKIVSLETAKLLKESGFRQDTLFSWSRTHVENPYILGVGVLQPWETLDKEHCISSPNTDELLEELPIGITIEKYSSKGEIRFCVREVETRVNHSSHNESLPEALASMWLWLKSEGLLEDKNVQIPK